MSRILRPMLVSSGALPADSEALSYEVKWDGFRALVHASRRGVAVTSRNGNDMAARYPELQALSGHVRTEVLLDGEIVCLDGDGRPDFAALWSRSRRSVGPRPSGATSVGDKAICYMIFDALAVDGALLVHRTYRERRQVLEDLELAAPHWCSPPSHVGEGAALFAATKQMGLEGVVAKRLDSRYRPGVRSRSWIKTKHFQTRTFALLGWLPPQEWRGDRGCIALGLETGDGIALAGVVESGYGRELVDQLPELTRVELRALGEPGRRWHEVEPATGEIKYLEWVPGMGLRHATVVPGSVGRLA